MKLNKVLFSIKAGFYIFLLILAYNLLEIAVIKGGLYRFESALFLLFYINCFIVIVKLVKKN